MKEPKRFGGLRPITWLGVGIVVLVFVMIPINLIATIVLGIVGVAVGLYALATAE